MMIREHISELQLVPIIKRRNIFCAVVFLAALILLPRPSVAQSNLGKTFHVGFDHIQGYPIYNKMPGYIIYVIAPHPTIATISFPLIGTSYQFRVDSLTKLTLDEYAKDLTITNGEQSAFISSADPIAVFVDENPLGGFSNDDEKLYADDFWYQPLPAERCGTRYYMQPYRYLGTSDLNGGMVSMHDTTLVFENFKNVLVSPTPPESLLAGNTLLPVNLTDVARDTIRYDTAGKDSIGHALLISSSKPMWMVSYDGFSDRSGNGTTGEYGEEYGGGGATIYPITDWGKEYYIMPQSPPYRPWPGTGVFISRRHWIRR